VKIFSAVCSLKQIFLSDCSFFVTLSVGLKITATYKHNRCSERVGVKNNKDWWVFGLAWLLQFLRQPQARLKVRFDCRNCGIYGLSDSCRAVALPYYGWKKKPWVLGATHGLERGL